MKTIKPNTQWCMSDHGTGVCIAHRHDTDDELNEHERAERALWRKAWHEALKTATPDEIMAGLQRALASQEWGAGPLGEGIPPAADWLQGRGWERRYTPEPRA